MGAISAWAAEKALKLAEDKIAKWMEVPNLDHLIANEVKEINNKLDVLIRAPFKQALMYLREGNLDKCREKVIEAISLDELDIPARLLYCDLLRLSGQYAIALDYYLEIIEKLGLRNDLAPPLLVSAYREKIFSSVPTAASPHFELTASDNYYPTDVWCSPGGIVVRWEQRDTPLFERVLGFVFGGGKPMVVVTAVQERRELTERVA